MPDPGCFRGGEKIAPGGAESFAVAAGGDAEMANEGAAHALGGAEAGIGRNGVELQVAAGETAAGLVEAGALDELRRGDAGLLGEAAGEAALAHGGAGGQRRHRKIGARVFDDEGADARKP